MIRILVWRRGARFPEVLETTFHSAGKAHSHLRFALEWRLPLGLPLVSGGFESLDPVQTRAVFVYGEW